MKPVGAMSQTELAGYVGEHLRERGIRVVLSGGACVQYYSEGAYVSKDLDFIDVYITGSKILTKAMRELGFEVEDRYYRHPETEYVVEFPPGPLSAGSEQLHGVPVSTSVGTFFILSPTDCVKDRLAAYFHWGDLQGLEQAVLVAKGNSIDLSEIERWSKAEGKLEAFLEVKHRLSPNR